MKDDYTTKFLLPNLLYTYLKVLRMYFLNWRVKGLIFHWFFQKFLQFLQVK